MSKFDYRPIHRKAVTETQITLHSNLGPSLISSSTSRANRCWDDERGTPKSEEQRSCSSLRGGCRRGTKRGDGFMGQFAFTRAQAQITPALILLPKWGARSPPSLQSTTKQAFVYIPLNFSPAICFDGPFLKHERFQPKNALLRVFNESIWFFFRGRFFIIYLSIWLFTRRFTKPSWISKAKCLFIIWT